MAKVAFMKGNSDFVKNLPIKDGQIIYDTQAKKHYVDSEGKRIDYTEQIQSDWNQNDISKADYIKNRICYESDKKVESDILSEITATFEPLDKYYVCTNDFLLPELAVGEPVVVYLDGVRYKTEVKTFNGMDYIGNFKIIADLNGIPNIPNTGESFAYSNDTGFFVTQGESHTIRITKFVNEVVVLPSKFIPNEVIRATPQTLTPEQQEQARKNIGAGELASEWVEIETVTTTVTAPFDRTEEPDGTPYNFSDVEILLKIPKEGAERFVMLLGNSLEVDSTPPNWSTRDTAYQYARVLSFGAKQFAYSSKPSISRAIGIIDRIQAYSTVEPINAKNIESIRTAFGNVPAGTEIKIRAVRA